MKSFGKLIRKGILLGCSLFLCMSQTAFAEDDMDARESYSYTVTFYAGNQGSFEGNGNIEVRGAEASISSTGDKITVTGLKYNDEIIVDAAGGMVNLTDGGKYYVRGIRGSGRDNDEVGTQRFEVKSDLEYVVAYGIQGNMVAYTVNYQDESGNPLFSSSTYYGNVGDRPVVAYKYIENYQPQAYNLTKTLSQNEADNVFTFTYRRIAEPQAGDGGTPGGNGNAGTGENAGTTGNEGNAGTAGTAGGTAGGTGTAESAGGTNDQAGNPGTIGNEEGTQTIDPTETPKDLVTLDDEETPKSKLEADDDPAGKAGKNRMAVYVTIAIIAVLGLSALITVIFRKRRNV